MSRMFDKWWEPESGMQTDLDRNSSPVATGHKGSRPELSETGKFGFSSMLSDTVACSSCGALIRKNSLFCSSCEAFRGAVVSERQASVDFEEVRPAMSLSEPNSNAIRDLWNGLRCFAPGLVALLAARLSRALSR